MARASLTRERVLRAAMSIADREGIASLTMRRLGEELKVEAMSLYNHVANKEDILDGIVDLVFSEIAVPAGGAGWKAAMRRRAISAREVLVRHPWAIGLLETRATPGPATLRHHDAVIGSLRNAGFPIRTAAHAYSVMDSYIYGFALQQTTSAVDVSKQPKEMAKDFLRQFPIAEYPHLAEMITKVAMKRGYDFADEYEFGLDLVLDGVEGLLKG